MQPSVLVFPVQILSVKRTHLRNPFSQPLKQLESAGTRCIAPVVFRVPRFDGLGQSLESLNPFEELVLGMSDDRDCALRINVPDDFLGIRRLGQLDGGIAEDVHLSFASVFEPGNQAEFLVRE